MNLSVDYRNDNDITNESFGTKQENYSFNSSIGLETPILIKETIVNNDVDDSIYEDGHMIHTYSLPNALISQRKFHEQSIHTKIPLFKRVNNDKWRSYGFKGNKQLPAIGNKFSYKKDRNESPYQTFQGKTNTRVESVENIACLNEIARIKTWKPKEPNNQHKKQLNNRTRFVIKFIKMPAV